LASLIINDEGNLPKSPKNPDAKLKPAMVLPKTENLKPKTGI
jgi:hypothetical protein